MIEPGLIDMMVRLRGRGISDNRVMRAMELTPRRLFVRKDQQPEAYDEQSMPIACGQTISPPLTVAMMTQALEVGEEHKVLEIGTGSGYHTVVLAHLAKRVYSVARYAHMMRQAEDRFVRLEITNVVTRHGDGRRGWPSQAPFDRIMVTAGLAEPPQGLLDQLAKNGRLVAVVSDELMIFDKATSKVTSRSLLPLIIPMIEAGKSKGL